MGRKADGEGKMGREEEEEELGMQDAGHNRYSYTGSQGKLTSQCGSEERSCS